MASSNSTSSPEQTISGSLELKDGGIHIDGSGIVVSARAWAPGVTRISVGAPGESIDEPSRVVAQPSDCSAATEWLDSAGVELRLEGQILRLWALPMRLELCDEDGQVLVTSDQDEPLRRLPDDGGLELGLCLPDDMVCLGLGQKHGGLNKRGRRWLMANSEPIGVGKDKDPLYQSHPFMIGLHAGRAFGVYLDCAAHTWFDIDHTEPGRALIGTPRTVASFYLIAGPDPRDVIERYTGLVGRTPLPPRWALGHHQSRWSYKTEKKVRAIAEGLDRHELPTDAIHLDIEYMRGYRVFTWNQRRFPDPARLMDDLEEQGLKTVAILDPGVKVDEKYDVYREGAKLGHFARRADGTEYRGSVWPGTTAFPDFTRGETRSWWAGHVAGLLESGVAGIWNDMNEPAWWIPLPNRNLLRRGSMRPDDVVFEDGGRRTAFPDLHNLYASYEAEATIEAFQGAAPGRRPFVLTRSGYPGIQRLAAMWTGDNASKWEDLAGSMPMLAGLGLSGYPFCGADIGGFSHPCNAELYGRWIQLGSIYPFCRTHCMKGMRKQEPWSFGERITKVAKEALETRYRLLPYLVTLFRRAELSGLPPMAPLLLEFPDDPEAMAREDQVMLGSELMAAPVVTKGASEREVYFPAGPWFDARTGQRFEGEASSTISAPLEAGLPLFARAGALIPLWPIRRRAGAPLPQKVGLRGFPSGERAGRLSWFDEEGDGFGYLEGGYCEIPYELRCEPVPGRGASRVVLSRGEQRGDVPPVHDSIEIEIFLTERPQSVTLEGAELVGKWDYRDGAVRCELREPRSPWQLEILLASAA